MNNLVFTTNRKTVYRDLAAGQGGVALHLETGAYHGFNETGARIWKMIDGRRNVEQITSEISEGAGEAPEHLVYLVADFLYDCTERDLISPTNPEAN